MWDRMVCECVEYTLGSMCDYSCAEARSKFCPTGASSKDCATPLVPWHEAVTKKISSTVAILRADKSLCDLVASLTITNVNAHHALQRNFFRHQHLHVWSKKSFENNQIGANHIFGALPESWPLFKFCLFATQEGWNTSVTGWFGVPACPNPCEFWSLSTTDRFHGRSLTRSYRSNLFIYLLWSIAQRNICKATWP